jgi:hypothetical protein
MGRKEDNQERRKRRREEVAKQHEEEQKARDAKRLSGRRHFFGKARKGDAVKVDFTFSGVPVPVSSEEEPDQGLVERTAQQEALWANLKEGEEPN